MKRFGPFTLALLIFFITFFNSIEARLLIIPPQQMIEQSTLIVIGTVTKKEYSEQHRQVVISVETIVKGATKKKDIELKQEKPPKYGWLGFDFPEKGTKIMVLLQQNGQLILTGDANAVAVLDDDHNVRLYKGYTMGEWTPEQYEKAYKAFLDKSIQSSSMPIDELNDNSENEIFHVKSHHLKHKIGVLITTVIIIGAVVVTSVIVYRILKHKKH